MLNMEAVERVFLFCELKKARFMMPLLSVYC